MSVTWQDDNCHTLSHDQANRGDVSLGELLLEYLILINAIGDHYQSWLRFFY